MKEVLTIIGVGIALAAVILPGQRALREDISNQSDWLRNDISNVRKEVSDVRKEVSDVRKGVSDIRKELSDLRNDMANLDVRVGHLEGLLKGLRGHNQAAQPAEIREPSESVASISGGTRERAVDGDTHQ